MTVVPFKAPHRHPILDTLAALDAALAAGAVQDRVAANWLQVMAGAMRGLLAELLAANIDAGRWRASCAALAARRAPMEALGFTVGTARQALAGMAQRVAAADPEGIDPDALRRDVAMLAAAVDNLIVPTEGLAMGYENLRARLGAGSAA